MLREKNEILDLKKFFISCFIYDRDQIKKKLRKITKLKYEDLDTDFDTKVKKILETLDKPENFRIKDDFSYNVVVI